MTLGKASFIMTKLQKSVRQSSVEKSRSLVERARLEIVYTPKGYRGFESLHLRHREPRSHKGCGVSLCRNTLYLPFMALTMGSGPLHKWTIDLFKARGLRRCVRACCRHGGSHRNEELLISDGSPSRSELNRNGMEARPRPCLHPVSHTNTQSKSGIGLRAEILSDEVSGRYVSARPETLEGRSLQAFPYCLI